MNNIKPLRKALISVYYKEGLDTIINKLHTKGVEFYSTGGTYDYITSLGIECNKVEDLTGYPSILGGRVKTLHPKVFGGILGRPDLEQDKADMLAYNIDTFDLVVVNLYPFEQTVSSGAGFADVIEKIDIGGISLIRAAAKNYNHVLCISSADQYDKLLEIANRADCNTDKNERLEFAAQAFIRSSSYDSAISNYLISKNAETGYAMSPSLAGNTKSPLTLRNQSNETRNAQPDETGNDQPNRTWNALRSLFEGTPVSLRYGENPHQNGTFIGNIEEVFTQLHGKELSYNNLLDLEAGISLINDFEETTFAILKHNNACGIASRDNVTDAWNAALEADPVSAYGGVLITNASIDEQAAVEINKIFFEIILAPHYEKKALEILQTKKNRIILQAKSFDFQDQQFRSILNGVLVQDKDLKTEKMDDLNVITLKEPDAVQMEDLIFANKVVKHSKSNAIVLAMNRQLLGSGIGQTSRVDALRQAIEKANSFGLNLKNAVMASDAFFPFADSVEIAHKAGITSVIQPGGSVRDNETIEYCNKNNISMAFTGIRHFKH